MPKLIEIAIEKAKLFANKSNDVDAMISFGSSNRKNQDEYSDLDLFLFTTSPQKYLNEENDKWLVEYFGPILSRAVVKDPIDNVLFNRIIMKDGFSLDIITINVIEFKKAKYYLYLKKYKLHKLIPSKIRKVIEDNLYIFHYFLKRGNSILYDNINIYKLLKLIFKSYNGEEEKNILTTEKFQQNHNQFWQTCYKIHQRLYSNDFYYAIVFLDNIIKKNLIQIINWYTLLNNKDKNIDVFYNGAKINEWCDPYIVENLYAIFLHTDIDKMRASVLNTIDIYQRISYSIASKNGITCNKKLETAVLELIKNTEPEELKNISHKRNIIIDLIKSVAENNSDIKAIVSFVDPDINKKDQSSNITICLLTTKPKKYLEQEWWLKQLKNIISSFIYKGISESTVSLMLEDGIYVNIIILNSQIFKKITRFFWLKKHKLDKFLFSRAKKATQNNINKFYNSFKKDCKVLHDTIGVQGTIKQILINTQISNDDHVLDNKKFNRNYNQFWQTSYKMIIKLIRKDFYYAIIVTDNVIKKQLMQMIEWYMLMNNDKNVFKNGVEVTKWCDPKIVKELFLIFPHTSIIEMQKSILKTLDIYKKLSHIIAQRHNYEVNEEFESFIYNFIYSNINS